MVDASVWKLYLGLSGGAFFWISFVITFGGTKLADVAQTLWLSNWSGSCESFFRGLFPCECVADAARW